MEKNKNPVAEFPEKIDRLMMAVDKVNRRFIYLFEIISSHFFRYTRFQNINQYIFINELYLYINSSFAFVL